jgi:NADH:ubiquinone oxidoreductase subunit 5 (subunit L)/multisubunit Na+/H+ antiporter MnhA subunit
VLGFAGALLHVLNHALFKGLLFLGTGSVLHATHTGEIDHLGGLLRRMPWTGMTFLVGCVAIVGLPPLNGFVSEFLIYFGAFKGVGTSGPLTVVACLGVIGGLALIGGLAAACFAKAFGIVFLGEPRSVHAQEARESRHLGMLSAMVILAVACVLFGLLGPLTVAGATPAIARAAGLDGATTAAALAPAVTSLSGVILVAGILLIAAGSLLLLRFLLLKGRTVTEAGTWDCGYARPTVRMQYTASSFAQPLTTLFRMFLRTHRTIHMPDELFPKEAAVSTETPDAFRRKVYQPVFRFVLTQLERVRQIQHGHLQLYVLYIAVALLILLLWKMR